MRKATPLSLSLLLLAATAAVAVLIWAPGLLGLSAAIAAAIVWSICVDAEAIAKPTSRGSEEP